MDLEFLKEGGTGHQIPNDDVLDMWKDIKGRINFKSVTEIGFNAGHSSCIVLELFPDVKVTSYDIGKYSITAHNALVVWKRYGNRFKFILSDTKLVRRLSRTDLVFIDGDHTYPGVLNDWELTKRSGIRYALLDDLQNKGVKQFIEKHNHEYFEIERYQYESNTGRQVTALLVEVSY